MSTESRSRSPVVDSTWHKRHQSATAKKSLVSNVVVAVLLALIYSDVKYHTVFRHFKIEVNELMWKTVELCVGLILVIKIFLNSLSLASYFWSYLFSGPVDLTERQRVLLGVHENEHGFRTPPPQQRGQQQSLENSLIFSTSQGSFSSGDGSPSSMMRPLSPGYTSHSPGFASPSPGFASHSLSTPSHYQFHTSSPGQPVGGAHSFEKTTYHSSNTSGYSPSMSYHGGGDSSLRSRHAFSTPRSASTSPYERITDLNTLDSFLQDQAEKEMRSKQAAPENLNTGSSSFWSYGASALDLTYTLRKYAYQLATLSPQSPAKTSSADQAVSGFDEVWSKYGVTEDDLYHWTEKLRKWLSATIVSRLSKKISDVNNQLQRIGCEDMQIGEVSVATLKQLALTKGSMVPSLNDLVPYLDFFANQEYLVRRIQDLSTGSMSEFTWNKGGLYGKPWGEHLITDAALVMHLLCTYLDTRLPAQPRHMDGRVFTAQHFIKIPDKPDMQRKDNFLIYQTSIHPPHFQVIIGTETYSLPKGRNNMFQAILLFFYHVRTKEGGMLGRINLGMSGLNILWIFD